MILIGISMDSYSAILRLKSGDPNRILFKSQRFSIRVLRPNVIEYSEYLIWMRDSKSNPFISGIDKSMSLSELNEYVSNKFEDPASLFLGIYTQDENTHIGNIKFEMIDTQDDVFEVGILIGDQNWRNKGVATEIITSSIIFLSKEINIRRYELGVHKDNKAAIHAYKKVGFLTVSEIDNINYLRMRFLL